MKRRDFLKNAGAGAAGAATLAAPAIVKAQATVNWRCASSFPKSLDVLYGAADYAAKMVGEMSGGKFNIRMFGPGEIVPALQVLDAVQNGTIELGHTAPYYYIGKDPTWAFGTAVPFGLNARQTTAWWYNGGEQVFNEFTQANGVVSILGGNTGAQMGGWFRKEIRNLKDLEGVKMRIAGWGGELMSKMGVVPTQIAAGEIYQALERGTIDAAEWVGPHDDEKLGFAKVARYYYYPGWWEGGAALHFMVGRKAWDALSKEHQAMLRMAGHAANDWMLARYDALNPVALRRLVATGAQLRAFPRDMMELAFKNAGQLYAETGAKNPAFKKVHDSYMAFRDPSIAWMRVTENTFDDFMATVKR